MNVVTFQRSGTTALAFYVAEDRLYYSTLGAGPAGRDGLPAESTTSLGPGSGPSLRYITLDRVPVRPLPHRSKQPYDKGHHHMTVPDMAISLVQKRVLTPIGGRVLEPGSVFGVVAGAHTYFLAAESPKEAAAWVKVLRDTWIHCFKHSLRGTSHDTNGEKSKNRVLEERARTSTLYEVEVRTGKMKVRCKDVGLPVTLRVWTDSTGRRPDWFLDYIRLRKQGASSWVLFPCARWFSAHMDDCRTTRVLFAGHAAPYIHYKVMAHTSDKRGAGTDANVFFVMHGVLGNGQRHILAGGADDFDRGGTSEFTVDDEELGELLEVSIGHDNSGHGPSWHLSHVEVVHEKTGQQWLFPCHQWFDSHVGDGAVERSLQPASGLLQKGFFTFLITTSDQRGAGTDADVHVSLHGEGGDTPTTMLPSRPEHFERGQTDSFRLELPHIGQPRKLTIGHNNKGPGPDWHLELVEVVEESSGRHYLFPCNKWLAVGMEDGRLERTLRLSEVDPRVNKSEYKVEFHTSSRRGSGTDANVYFKLVGAGGESAIVRVVAPKEAFERGQVDTFSYPMPFLGQLQTMLLQHDNSGSNPAWHLLKVVVTCSREPEPYVFVCNKWLQSKDPAVQPSVELVPGLPLPTTLKYKIEVVTSDCRGAGTEAHVTVELVGSNGRFGPVALDTPSAFERAKVDTFVVEGADVGILSALVVKSDGTGTRAFWHLEGITVWRDETHSDPAAGVFFPCKQWFSKDTGFAKELHPGKKAVENRLSYTIRVTTSDIKGAGTDAGIEINLLGATGETGYHPLMANYDTFERGQEDAFTLLMKDVGQPQALLVRSDGKSRKPTWHMDFASLESTHFPPAFFVAGKWLGPDVGLEMKVPVSGVDPRSDRKEYRVFVHTSDVKSAGTDADVYIDMLGDLNSSGKQPLSSAGKETFSRGRVDEFTVSCKSFGALRSLRVMVGGRGHHPWHLDMVIVIAPSGERYFFSHGDWLSPKVPMIDIPASTIDPSLDKRTYKVLIRTSDRNGAGTDANVYVNIHGSHTSSGNIVLRNTNTNNFERRQADMFEITTRDLGNLVELVVGHDNAGAGANWHLEQVEITDTHSNRAWFFESNAWFDKAQGDGKIERLLKASSADPRANRNTYKVVVHTGDMPGAGTDSNVYVILRGDAGASGKLPLSTSGNQQRGFARSQTDGFTLVTKGVGRLRELLVGHDNSGATQARWHLAQVEVTDVGTGQDGGQWQHRVRVVHLEACSDLMMRVVGGAHPALGDGCPACSRIAHPRRGPQPVVDAGSWQLAAGHGDTGGDPARAEGGVGAAVRGAHSHDVLFSIRAGWQGTCWFECDQWFDSGSGDQQVERLLTAQLEKPASKLTQYKVLVVTSKRMGAGTDANVFVDIHGVDGSTTGKLALARTGQHNFAGGSTDEFMVTGRDVGAVRHIRVGHDNSGTGAAWHLEHIQLLNAKTGASYLFPCRKWFSKSKDDLQTERDLLPAGSLVMEHEYEVTVVTSTLKGAGTDANVFVQMYGDAGDSGVLRLDNPKNNFETGDTDVFHVKAPDCGKLQRLRLWHDNKGLGAAWHCEIITVVDTVNGGKTFFYCGQWLDKNHGVEKTLTASAADPRDHLVTYTVTTHTSTLRGAGTDANVRIDLIGAAGSSGARDLTGPGNLFEQVWQRF
ncbi:MAG: hypothetical protein WDW38_002885 [Sanguina aurantia]